MQQRFNKQLTKIIVFSILALLVNACSAYQAKDMQLGFKFKCAGVKEAYLDLGEARIHYWYGGQGTPLVMLHGFGGDAKLLWAEQMILAKQYFVIAPDLVYFGGSTSNSGDFSFDFQVKMIAKLLDQLSINKYYIMGNSYGGLVAFRLANDYPDRVLKLVISDSPGTAFTQDDLDRILKTFNAKSIVDVILPHKPEDMRRIFNIAYYKAPPLPGFALKDIYENLGKNQVTEKTKMLEYIINNKEELLKRTYSISQPTLLVWGKYDKLFPLDVAERLKSSLGDKAILQIIDQAGHVPNMEQPKEFNRLALDFLR